MRAAPAAVAAVIIAFWAGQADARTADYSVSEAQFRSDAEALDVSNFPELPKRSNVDLVIEDAAKLDQQLRILSISCKAWKVENPLSKMVARVLGDWDRDGTIGAPARPPLVRFRVQSALSSMRCVQVKELKTRCITRTAINGEATVEADGAAPRVQPVSVEVEQEQSVGVCGGLARGTAISGRAASIALANRLTEIAAAR